MFKHAIVRLPGPDFAQGLTTVDLGAPDYQEALRQHGRYCCWQSGNRFFQVFFNHFFAHRHRRAEVTKGVAERDDFCAETLGELAHADPREIRLRDVYRAWISLA